MFANEVVAYCELLAQVKSRTDNRLAVQTSEHDSCFIVRIIDKYPHPFGFQFFII